MLGFGPISSSAVTALPDYLLNTLSASFTGTVTYESVPFSPYSQLILSGVRMAYSIELSLRAVR